MDPLAEAEAMYGPAVIAFPIKGTGDWSVQFENGTYSTFSAEMLAERPELMWRARKPEPAFYIEIPQPEGSVFVGNTIAIGRVVSDPYSGAFPQPPVGPPSFGKQFERAKAEESRLVGGKLTARAGVIRRLGFGGRMAHG